MGKEIILENNNILNLNFLNSSLSALSASYSVIKKEIEKDLFIIEKTIEIAFSNEDKFEYFSLPFEEIIDVNQFYLGPTENVSNLYITFLNNNEYKIKFNDRILTVRAFFMLASKKYKGKNHFINMPVFFQEKTKILVELNIKNILLNERYSSITKYTKIEEYIDRIHNR